MALTVNTNIVNDTDQYLLDAKNVKGTYVVVSGTTERDNLPTATKVTGTLVFCQSDSTFYRYNGSNWVVENFGVEAISEDFINSLFTDSNTTT